MPRLKTENHFPEYIRVRKQDQKRLSELTLKAMGDRSVSEFAGSCGVAPSTITRLLKMENKGPSSDHLINAIWENASDNIGMEKDAFKAMLLDAYGLMPRDQLSGEHEVYRDDMPSAPNLVDRSLRDTSRNFDTQAREIIISQLVSLGYTVKEKSIGDSSEKKYFEFALSTDALQGEGIAEWYFEPMYGYRFPSSDYIQNLYVYLYKNSFSGPQKACSIVVSHQNSFDDVLKKVEEDIVHDYISVLLVDTNVRKVTNEFILQQKDKKEHTPVFCP